MPPLTAHPLWTQMYAASSTVTVNTANAIAYACQYAAVAVAQRAKKREESQHTVLRFKEVALQNTAAPAANAFAAVNDVVVPLDTSFADHLTGCAKRVFCTPSLRRDQPTAVERIIFNDDTDGKLMLCVRTGGGKSLTMYLTAVSVGGIALVIIPLLSLTANQVEQIKMALLLVLYL